MCIKFSFAHTCRSTTRFPLAFPARRRQFSNVSAKHLRIQIRNLEKYIENFVKTLLCVNLTHPNDF